MFWALFVVGHDCGHACSPATNGNLIGHLCHTPILRFHGWRISHRTQILLEISIPMKAGIR